MGMDGDKAISAISSCEFDGNSHKSPNLATFHYLILFRLMSKNFIESPDMTDLVINPLLIKQCLDVIAIYRRFFMYTAFDFLNQSVAVIVSTSPIS